MARQLLLISLLFGLSSAAQTSSEPSTSSSDAPPDSIDPTYHKAGQTPFWLPRQFLLGTYLRRGTMTPQPRLQWQFTFFEKRKDALVLLLEGGLGYSLVLPENAVEGLATDVPFDSFYENTVMLGAGYRNQSPDGWHWGFQVTAGPLWYGAHFTNLPDERYTAGLMEGRVQVGYQFGPTVLGASLGYGEPFSYKRRSVSRYFAGGVLLGLFADWR
jgi:hypothetical protein